MEKIGGYSDEEICRVDPDINDQLNNIAANIGISKTQFLKGYFREVVEGEPEEHKIGKIKDDKIMHVKVSGVSNQLKADLKIIATHHGLSKNAFLRMKLHQIVEAYPARMRKPPLDY